MPPKQAPQPPVPFDCTPFDAPHPSRYSYSVKNTDKTLFVLDGVSFHTEAALLYLAHAREACNLLDHLAHNFDTTPGLEGHTIAECLEHLLRLGLDVHNEHQRLAAIAATIPEDGVDDDDEAEKWDLPPGVPDPLLDPYNPIYADRGGAFYNRGPKPAPLPTRFHHDPAAPKPRATSSQAPQKRKASDRSLSTASPPRPAPAPPRSPSPRPGPPSPGLSYASTPGSPLAGAHISPAPSPPPASASPLPAPRLPTPMDVTPTPTPIPAPAKAPVPAPVHANKARASPRSGAKDFKRVLAQLAALRRQLIVSIRRRATRSPRATPSRPALSSALKPLLSYADAARSGGRGVLNFYL